MIDNTKCEECGGRATACRVLGHRPLRERGVLWHPDDLSDGEEMQLEEQIEGGDGWSQWVNPALRGYVMGCCDCGLSHEMEFAVLRFDSAQDRFGTPIEDAAYEVAFRARRMERRCVPQDDPARARFAAIVELATWDADGAVAPAYDGWSWESVARTALDISYAALGGKP
jgi:hypothetical protein